MRLFVTNADSVIPTKLKKEWSNGGEKAARSTVINNNLPC
jgi:hypothetical protein